MIIGNGDIASVLPESELLFFASGVSNSQETRGSEYRREADLLLAQSTSKHLVYFSTLSLFYTGNRYTQHKQAMEKLVRATFPHYTIVRLGNISWGTNPHTIINHFREQRKRGEELVIQDTYRYVVDEEEFLHWISLIPKWNCEMNIPGQRMSVQEIVECLV